MAGPDRPRAACRGLAATVGIVLLLVGGTTRAAADPAGAASVGAPALEVAVTTTVVTPTTDSVPTTTTTTTTPTTTTSPPTTTSSSTTTTSSSTTTTTMAPTAATNTSSNTPWALIIVIVVLVLAIGLVILLLAARKRRGAEQAWRRGVVPALSDAQLARASLLSDNAVSDDAEVRSAVAVQVERAAVALDHAVPTAPDADAGAMATTAAGALRGLAFAIEADRLLRHGTAAPTGLQLAEADEARRARSSELTAALVKLSARVGSAPG
jgi:hypothetical protein